MRALRRTMAVAGLSVLTAAGFLALAEQPASAVGLTFYVGGTAANDDSTCGGAGTAPAPSTDHPCKTVPYAYHVRSAAAGGDTINVRPGTYVMSAAAGSVANGTSRLLATKPMTIQRDPAVAGTAILDGNNVFVGNTPIILVNGGALTLRDLTIRNGNGGVAVANAHSGSALFQLSGATTLENVIFQGNKANHTNPPAPASAVGGAVYVHIGQTLTVTNGEFNANESPSGGAVYVNAGATATFTGTKFSGNKATTAGGLNQGGAIYNNGATVTLTNAELTGNSALGRPTVNNTGQGGAIFANNGSTTTLTNTKLSGNTITMQAGAGAGTGNAIGGAILAGSGALTLQGGTLVDGNTVTGGPGNNGGMGGGIYTVLTTLIVDDSDVTNNKAIAGTGAGSGRGGGIYTFSTNATIRNGSTVTGNEAKGGAGANTGQGGGVANDFNLLVNASSITGNTATGAAGATSGSGGGVWTAAGILTVQQASHVDGNHATRAAGGPTTSGQGGGVYALSGTTNVLTGSTVSGNDAVNGGGILDLATLTVDGSTVQGNVATAPTGVVGGQGGGIFTQTTSPVVITGSTIKDNTATGSAVVNSGLGGGLLQLFGTTTITNTDIVGNDATGGTFGATGLGGGMLNSLGTANISGGSMTGNTALLGGALVSNQTTTVGATTISGNAAIAGGGIYTVAGLAPQVLTLNGTTVDDNDGLNAGGIWHSSGTLNGNGLNLTNNTATATAANLGLGGGLYNSATATLTGGTIAGNTAAGINTSFTGLGGGAFNQSKLTLNGVSVSGNQATGNAGVFQTGWGGGLYNGFNAANTSAELVVQRSTLEGNTAVFGGALAGYAPGATSSAKSSLRRSTVSGNSAAGFGAGGGWYVGLDASTLSVVESTVTGNGSGLIMNAVSPATASANLAGSILFGNGAFNCNAAGNTTVDSGGHNLTNPSDTTCDMAVVTDDVFGDPQLDPLALNGGTTENHLPGPSSPALDQVPTDHASGVIDAVSGAPIVLCDVPGTDQRGAAVPEGPACDIGSVERAAVAPGVTGPTTGEFKVGVDGPDLTGFEATGSPTPMLSALGLPGGLALVTTEPGKAKITGTPDANTGGVYVVTIVASNGIGTDATHQVQITVYEKVIVLGPAQVQMVETIPASADYDAAGGFGAATFSLTGTLPDGVMFTEATGVISGTPTVGSAGTYDVTVVATNQAGATNYPVTITVVPLLTITTASLPGGQFGVTYDATVEAIGGTPPRTFALQAGSSLPAGLSLAADGTISGVPTAVPNTYTFTVVVTDVSDPMLTDTQELSITIGKGPTELIASNVLITQGPLGIRFGVVDATLRGGLPLQPIAGQTIVFKAGATTVCTATTNASGFAGCTVGAAGTLQLILAGGVTATYAGNTVWLPSSDTAGLL